MHIGSADVMLGTAGEDGVRALTRCAGNACARPDCMLGFRGCAPGRLRHTVLWLNMHRSADGLYLCTNQKERATDVAKLLGAKTKW